MIMMADWHPDIFEFIISKMQNPAVLQHLIATTRSPIVKKLASEKLSFTPLAEAEKEFYTAVIESQKASEFNDSQYLKEIKQKLQQGGSYSVKDSEFLSGANISVCLTKDFMDAVENDNEYALRFPAIEDYNEEEMADYDENWAEIGDVREWATTGRRVKTYETIQARELWNLITFCATYSAEPGIFL